MNLYQKYVSYYTIITREITRILRIWPQTLIPPLITTSLFCLIFGSIMGQYVKNNLGVPYINFIIPGLIIMSVITSAYENTVSAFFIPRFVRYIEELIVSPTPNYIIVAGYITGGIFRGILVGVLIFISANFFTSIQIESLFLMLIIAILAATIFSLAGLINAIFAKNFDHISWVTSFILTPLTYLGGVFYNIENLSGIWRKISLFNPIAHIISIFRYSFIGVKTDYLELSLIMMISLAIILFFIACKLLDRDISIKA